MKKLVIAVDFDNSIATEDAYPLAGKLIPGAKETINWLYDLGHTIIIWTCREKDSQDEAIEFLLDNDIKFHWYNTNDPDRVEKYANDSRKIGCDLIIDDKCVLSKVVGDTVDWELMREALESLFEIYD